MPAFAQAQAPAPSASPLLRGPECLPEQWHGPHAGRSAGKPVLSCGIGRYGSGRIGQGDHLNSVLEGAGQPRPSWAGNGFMRHLPARSLRRGKRTGQRRRGGRTVSCLHGAPQRRTASSASGRRGRGKGDVFLARTPQAAYLPVCPCARPSKPLPGRRQGPGRRWSSARSRWPPFPFLAGAQVQA